LHPNTKTVAIQTSLYTFRNKLGNVRGIKFGNLPDYYVGLLGGATREQILNDPNFVRTRENMSEFGAASEANRYYRIGVASFGNYMESYFSGYLNSITLKVLQLGTGPRGERNLVFSTNQPYFEQTNLNRNLTFGSVVGCPVIMSTNIGRNQATAFIAAFDPLLLLNPPAGATHFQFVLNATAMSDWAFINPTGYAPTNLIANGVNQTTNGTILPLNVTPPNITIVAALPGSPGMGGATLFTTIGIQFYQQINLINYALFEGNTAKIDLLF